jgi:hypothetical protein
MSHAMRRAAIAAIAAGAIGAASPAVAQSFADAPIACGALTAFKTCAASFDGWTLRIVYTLSPGRPSVATYRMCEAAAGHINCAGGEWRSGELTGPLGGRTIALRNGLPFPE